MTTGRPREEPDADPAPRDLAALTEHVALLERRVAREHTARLEAERIAEDGMRALYEANLDLDAKILERTEQLDAALTRAEAAVEAKGAFLAHMSHHLMTPLNGVVGMLELLSDSDFDEHHRSWHQSALRSAHRMDQLIRQILNFVEIDGVDLRREAPVRRLSDVLDAVEARWHTKLLKAGQLPIFEIAAGRSLWVAEPPALGLLFDELFANVVTHAHAGQVTVTIRHVEDNGVAVDVEDSGPGIPNDVREMAHALGVRADLEDTADGKASLGLALMTHIAVGLDGEVRFGERSPTTVSVVLPLERPQA